MRIAIAVVFPPGAAHMSSIRSPFWGSKTLKENFHADKDPIKSHGKK